jgi:hypothetical protein
MDKYRDLSDRRVEAAVNRAVRSITDNPTDLEITEREAAEEHDANAIQRSWAK